MSRVARQRISALIAFVALSILGGCSSDQGATPHDAGDIPSPDSERTCRHAIDMRPTYLPWLEDGNTIPEPLTSYDVEIDRAQLAWQERDGGLEVGLALYPHTPMGNIGEPTDIKIDGVEGHLHLQDEGGLIGMSWDLRDERCNYLELVLSSPRMPKRQAVHELVRIATSLRSP